jgi:hypothetical protein
LFNRQREPKRTALADFTFNTNFATMTLNDLGRKIQTNAKARYLIPVMALHPVVSFKDQPNKCGNFSGSMPKPKSRTETLALSVWLTQPADK